MQLTERERNTLLSTARMTLQAFVKTGGLPDLILHSPGLVRPAGALVSLHHLGFLRGCVGTLDEKPLYQNIMELTVSAASEDERYDPITPDELHQVRITVTVLEEFRPVTNRNEMVEPGAGLALGVDPPVILLPERITTGAVDPIIESFAATAGLQMDLTRCPVWRFSPDTFSEED